MEKLEEAKSKHDINAILSLQQGLKFNGGGHINHSIFWQNLAPIKEGGGVLESGELSKLIDAQFGSLTNLQTTLSNACVGLQGSGWGWLGYDKMTGRVSFLHIPDFFLSFHRINCINCIQLIVSSCPNQDPLQATTGHVPLLGIDVWEHAYYLQYKNVR